ncbi:hypothetical protein [Candidatus Fokinia solitaria]|uniref:hypothetical protein n=1 Tax=Candidatus Fokinia solitaria TaxID=1802984 RepID=UPI0011AB47E5|nr:hypothetical protein [Candidatus Fokinia solitaria]
MPFSALCFVIYTSLMTLIFPQSNAIAETEISYNTEVSTITKMVLSAEIADEIQRKKVGYHYRKGHSCTSKKGRTYYRRGHYYHRRK